MSYIFDTPAHKIAPMVCKYTRNVIKHVVLDIFIAIESFCFYSQTVYSRYFLWLSVWWCMYCPWIWPTFYNFATFTTLTLLFLTLLYFLCTLFRPVVKNIWMGTCAEMSVQIMFWGCLVRIFSLLAGSGNGNNKVNVISKVDHHPIRYADMLL